MSKTKKNDERTQRPPVEAEKGRVIPFPQRNAGGRPRGSFSARSEETPSPLRPDTLGREPADRRQPDDYRHRMLVNASAFALCVALVMAGIWMATTMAELRRGQDCVLSGRYNCGPVAVPPRREPTPS